MYMSKTGMMVELNSKKDYMYTSDSVTIQLEEE